MTRLALVLGLLLIGPVRPAVAGWTYASSDHFEVYTTAGEQRAREALAYFERVHAFFTDFLQLSPQSHNPTRLVIFSSGDEFAPYRPTEQAIAYYQPGPDRDYVVMQSFDAAAYPVVVHEYVHLVLRHSGDVYPVWLNEGMAEFFSTLSSFGGQMSIGRVPRDRLRYLNTGVSLLDLPRLFAIGHDAPEYRVEAHAGVFYSESWALVHMLLTGESYRDGWGRFRAAVAAGTPPAEALVTVYGRSVADVEADLRAYVRRGEYVYFSADYDAPAQATTFPARPVDVFEAGLVTANLLAVRRDGEALASAAYDELTRQRPDDLGLVEARAYFALQRGDDAEALPFLVRAVDLGSRNALLFHEYARLVRDYNPTLRRRLLGTAVEFDDDNLQYRLEYAASLLNAAEPDEALGVLDPVREVSARDAFMLFQLRANAYAQLGARDDARAVAELALQYATTDAQRTYATELLAGIE